MNVKVLSGISLVVAVVALWVSLSAGSKSAVPTDPNAPAPTQGEVVKGASGGDFFNPVQFFSSVTKSGSVSTTSMATAETVTASEFRAWTDASLVTFIPGLLGVETVTLPASSTLASIIPKAGDSKSFCMMNGTTSASTAVVFAGGLGTKLRAASSTATAVGSKTLITGGIGCFTLIRNIASTTGYDIDVLMQAYN